MTHYRNITDFEIRKILSIPELKKEWVSRNRRIRKVKGYLRQGWKGQRKGDWRIRQSLSPWKNELTKLLAKQGVCYHEYVTRGANLGKEIGVL